MNDRERMAWMMAVLVLILTRPGDSGYDEQDDEWEAQRERLLKVLPSAADFRKATP